MGYKTARATPTITAGAYSSLDAVGSKLEFEDVCTPFNNTGAVVQAHIKDNAKQNALLYLVLFDRDFTATADNDAFTVSDADLLNMVMVLEFAVADYIDFASNSIALVDPAHYALEHPFELKEGGTSLFGQLMVKTSTPTYVATNDLRVELLIKN
jgi:hypothetical protein